LVKPDQYKFMEPDEPTDNLAIITATARNHSLFYVFINVVSDLCNHACTLHYIDDEMLKVSPNT
jgi:hypothetical protein